MVLHCAYSLFGIVDVKAAIVVKIYGDVYIIYIQHTRRAWGVQEQVGKSGADCCNDGL